MQRAFTQNPLNSVRFKAISACRAVCASEVLVLALFHHCFSLYFYFYFYWSVLLVRHDCFTVESWHMYETQPASFLIPFPPQPLVEPPGQISNLALSRDGYQEGHSLRGGQILPGLLHLA